MIFWATHQSWLLTASRQDKFQQRFTESTEKSLLAIAVGIYPEAYLVPCQTSMTEHFKKVAKGF